MRTFEEIISREDRNTTEIVLYREGLFYKAYERSAYACVTRIRAFKPSKKRIKYLGREIVSVGFPVDSAAKYFSVLPAPLADGRIVILLEEPVCESEFEAWKKSLPLKTSVSRIVYPSAGCGADEVPDKVGEAPTVYIPSHPDTTGDLTEKQETNGLPGRVARMIRDFRLESSTPLQCVVFIDELKRIINGEL